MYISKIIDIFKGFFLSDATEPITQQVPQYSLFLFPF